MVFYRMIVYLWGKYQGNTSLSLSRHCWWSLHCHFPWIILFPFFDALPDSSFTASSKWASLQFCCMFNCTLQIGLFLGSECYACISRFFVYFSSILHGKCLKKTRKRWDKIIDFYLKSLSVIRVHYHMYIYVYWAKTWILYFKNLR